MDIQLALAILHSGGFSHKDLAKFAEKTLFDPVELLEDCMGKKQIPIPWMTDDRRNKILEKLQQIDPSKIQKILTDKHINIITKGDPSYPKRLATIKQSPYLLYVRGDLHEERLMLGIVGSRRHTHYGKKILDSIIPELIAVGTGIVSG